ncbi:hypothetical protein BH20VER1_BH20VER1_16830 [soil metagenome]
MILAAVDPAREAELRALLDSMNTAPGRVHPENAVIPFARLNQLHFSRLVLLDDKTTEDVRAYGLEPQTYPLYLAFLGDIDGNVDEFLRELARVAPDGLRALFSCCRGFTTNVDLVRWMKLHRAPAIANYVNWRGRTVQRVHEEAALRDAIEEFVERDEETLRNRPPTEVHTAVRHFVQTEKSAGRLRLSPEKSTPLRWRIRNVLHLLAFPFVVLLFWPLLIVLAPFYLLLLRRAEKTDPEICPRADQNHSDFLARSEDHYVTNQFTAMGSLKPGWLRLLTVIGVLTLVNWGARHIFTRGRLARIRTIHFARWVFLDGRRRMVFFSNYDGTVESYMDDFINKTGFGLNASFSNGIGYPRTNWLVLDGCGEEEKYKHYLRRHTLPTQVWYKAYPGLTAIDLERNGRIRAGVEKSSMTQQEAREWVALL